MASSPKLSIVANRLPVRQVKSGKTYSWETSPGGLVSALAPFLQKRKGMWIGWPGGSQRVKEAFEINGIKQVPVNLTAQEVDNFYHGFCNDTIWPLYHDSVQVPHYHRHWWWPYVDVNKKFTQASLKALKQTRGSQHIWVQDYQLQLVPAGIRDGLGKKAKIGFFLHIPFPPVELFAHIPWRKHIMEGLLGSDLVGFQTRRAVTNFLTAAERFTDAKIQGDGLRYQGRKIKVTNFPITVDVDKYVEAAAKPKVLKMAKDLRERLARKRKIILGIDRLDYTKGVDFRMKAFETLLRSKTIDIDDFVYIQVVVPSREKVPTYIELKSNIERMVGRINGEYGDAGRVPIQYLHRSLKFDEMMAYYVAADIMLVTPLRDGMNLVCKEYLCSRQNDEGILILSEFAGAAEELKNAMMVNPFDVDGLAERIVHALDLPKAEEKKRMKALRKTIQGRSVHQWAENFIGALSN